MRHMTKGVVVGALGLVFCLITGCATIPGGIAPSSTPLEGRTYIVLGYTEATDSRICLFGFIPISPHNSVRDAIQSATRRVGGDALIEVTAESYTQYWFLFSRDITRVEGVGIRFTK